MSIIYSEFKKNTLGKGYDKESNTAPHSHIAIFDSDAGNGYGYFLGQNQPDAYVTVAKLPYKIKYLKGGK